MNTNSATIAPTFSERVELALEHIETVTPSTPGAVAAAMIPLANVVRDMAAELDRRN